MKRVISYLILFCLSTQVCAEDLKMITVGAGEVAGSYYASARAICDAINLAQRGRLRCSPDPTAGSTYNLQALRRGQLDFALVQSDWQRQAYEGWGNFAKSGPMKDLRSVLGLYPEAITIVARRDAGITNLADLLGKRIDIGHPASGRRATTQRLLRLLDLSAADFTQLELTIGGAIDEICAGRLDATILVVGHPNSSVARALTDCDAVIVPATGPRFDAAIATSTDYSPTVISGSSYPDLDADVPTFAVFATLVTRSQTDASIVHTVVKRLLDRLPEVTRNAPVLAPLGDVKMRVRGLTAPLHPGAKSALEVELPSGAVGSADVRIKGSGASFPFPLYAQWFKDFSTKTNGVTVAYQPKGSGAGINDLINGAVDFAGSDAAMSNNELAKMKEGVVLLPVTAGAIAIAYNLPGVKQLKLPRDVYVDIFLGKIERWNDPRIEVANNGVKLPDLPITVVVRADSSGTTYNLTGHLSAVSEEFRNGVGQGKTVQWPSTSRLSRAPSNSGVAATIAQNPGSIGYIEYGYATLTKTPTALLENKAGKFVQVGTAAASVSLAKADFDHHLRAFVFDPPGDDSYPIVSFTWLMFPEKNNPPEKVEAIQKLIEYIVTTGQRTSKRLGYVPLPVTVIQKIREAAKQIN